MPTSPDLQSPAALPGLSLGTCHMAGPPPAAPRVTVCTMPYGDGDGKGRGCWLCIHPPCAKLGKASHLWRGFIRVWPAMGIDPSLLVPPLFPTPLL